MATPWMNDCSGRVGRRIVPNHADLREELAFAAVWNRPGLALPDRMIAALAALSQTLG